VQSESGLALECSQSHLRAPAGLLDHSIDLVGHPPGNPWLARSEYFVARLAITRLLSVLSNGSSDRPVKGLDTSRG
jgi:hypothetical protein